MPRYAAFISYSHADADVARWLHHGLETYRFPRQVVGLETPFGPATRRLEPIFRDREELPAAGDLGDKLRDALREARHLIVICSPRSAKSQWVNEEVRYFKAHHGADRVLALIASGEPGHPELECFPPALKFKLDAAGQVSDVPAEPIAADIRPGKDGKRLARLKLLAGLSGLPLDQLARRDVQRRQQRLVWISAASSLIAVMTAGLAVYANSQRIEATRQRDIAQSSLEFLVNTFEIANPATENPRTITAITVLDRASKRAAAELGDKPEVAARLLRTTGEIYLNLGLTEESERDLLKARALAPEGSLNWAIASLQLAKVAVQRGDRERSERLLDEVEASASGDGDEALLAARIAEGRALGRFMAMDLSGAADGFDRAAALYATAPGDHRAEVARMLANAGSLRARAGDHARADATLREAQDLFLATLGPRNVQTASAGHIRASALFEAGRAAEARPLLAEAIARYQSILDADHPRMFEARLLEGRIAHALGQPGVAASHFAAARAMATRLFPEGDLSFQAGDASFYRARALSDAGDHAAALADVEAARAAYDARYGPDDPDQVELAQVRARILRASGRTAEARAECAAALALRRKLDPADPELPAAARLCAGLAGDPPGVPLLFEDMARAAALPPAGENAKSNKSLAR